MKREFISIVLVILFGINLILAGELRVTQEHPFLIDGKWIPASSLEVGDELVSVDGKKIKITSIKDVFLENPVLVYNLEAGVFHDFVVGEENVVVHNSEKPRRKCGCASPGFGNIDRSGIKIKIQDYFKKPKGNMNKPYVFDPKNHPGFEKLSPEKQAKFRKIFEELVELTKETETDPYSALESFREKFGAGTTKGTFNWNGFRVKLFKEGIIKESDIIKLLEQYSRSPDKLQYAVAKAIWLIDSKGLYDPAKKTIYMVSNIKIQKTNGEIVPLNDLSLNPSIRAFAKEVYRLYDLVIIEEHLHAAADIKGIKTEAEPVFLSPWTYEFISWMNIKYHGNIPNELLQSQVIAEADIISWFAYMRKPNFVYKPHTAQGGSVDYHGRIRTLFNEFYEEQIRLRYNPPLDSLSGPEIDLEIPKYLFDPEDRYIFYLSNDGKRLVQDNECGDILIYDNSGNEKVADKIIFKTRKEFEGFLRQAEEEGERIIWEVPDEQFALTVDCEGEYYLYEY